MHNANKIRCHKCRSLFETECNLRETMAMYVMSTVSKVLTHSHHHRHNLHHGRIPTNQIQPLVAASATHKPQRVYTDPSEAQHLTNFLRLARLQHTHIELHAKCDCKVQSDIHPGQTSGRTRQSEVGRGNARRSGGWCRCRPG
jgi:hypothetical protein